LSGDKTKFCKQCYYADKKAITENEKHPKWQDWQMKPCCTKLTAAVITETGCQSQKSPKSPDLIMAGEGEK